MPDSRDIPATKRFAWILGLAGLLPFVAQALFSWLSPPVELAGVLRSQVHYAAAILTFLGAVHWGVTLVSQSIVGTPAATRLVWGVTPALFCWVITLYPINTAMPMLFFGLLSALVIDLILYRATSVPRWFLTLRVVLSTVALASVGASWIAMSVRLSGAK
jgi:hypothetical protein